MFFEFDLFICLFQMKTVFDKNNGKRDFKKEIIILSTFSSHFSIRIYEISAIKIKCYIIRYPPHCDSNN